MVAIPVFDTEAQAAQITKGTLHNFFPYDEANTGLLVVKTDSGEPKFRINKKTDCGYTGGQFGGEMPCRQLGKGSYQDQPVRVKWEYSDGLRKAIQVVVYID